MTYCSKWKLLDSIPETPSHPLAHRKHPFATQITPTYGTNTANLTPSVCVCVCLPPFPHLPQLSPLFPSAFPPILSPMSMPTCQSFYENVKVSNSLELRWECLTVHKCPTLDLHKYFARLPENGMEKRAENVKRRMWGGEGVESWSMCGEHLKNFPKCEKSNKRPRLRCLFTVFSFPSRIAEHFPLFMVAILFREPSKKFPPLFYF